MTAAIRHCVNLIRKRMCAHYNTIPASMGGAFLQQEAQPYAMEPSTRGAGAIDSGCDVNHNHIGSGSG